MSYTPIADSAFIASIPGTSATWPALIANDRAAFELYTPGLEANPYHAATAFAREFRWREYGGLDAPLISSCLVVGVLAEASAGPQTVSIATPGVDSDTVAVNGAAWYTAQLDAAGPMQEVIVSCAAPGAGTLAFAGIRSHRAYSTAAAGTLYPSGFRKIGTVWGTADYPVPSEIASRLRTNPIRLAIDRPVCVACHISDTIKAISTKSLDLWGVEDSTNWQLVGRMVVPLGSDRSTRWYRVDAYTVETVPGTGEFSVRVGATEERWTGPGWHSWRVRLGHGQHAVTATIKAGTPNEASIRTLQVWRTEL